MPVVRYNLLTLAGNAVWCLALAGIGWVVGSSYKAFDHGFRYGEYALAAGVVLLGGFWVVRRGVNRLRD